MHADVHIGAVSELWPSDLKLYSCEYVLPFAKWELFDLSAFCLFVCWLAGCLTGWLDVWIGQCKTWKIECTKTNVWTKLSANVCVIFVASNDHRRSLNRVHKSGENRKISIIKTSFCIIPWPWRLVDVQQLQCCGCLCLCAAHSMQ